MSISPPPYVGRFAPTPSGYLHFGSLVAALASFLDARAAGGLWRVRMEDLDPPREVPGTQAAILQTLENHGLEWDGEVIRQSQRQAAYQAALAQLQQQGLVYGCNCSRKTLAGRDRYPGHCREARVSGPGVALRLKVPDRDDSFSDRLQGTFRQNLQQAGGDFVIRRRDGLFAYQLAVVVDDAWQGITDVVRGADLLDSTPRQRYLQDCLGLPHPRYLHIPLLVQPDGHKLGKRYRSPPLRPDQAGPQLLRALRILGQQPPPGLQDEAPSAILAWACTHWRPQQIPACHTLAEAWLD